VLRHRPDSLGLELKEGGWIEVERLLAAMQSYGKSISLEVLQTVVPGNDKQLFEFSTDGLHIRARQGHSIDVDLGYKPALPPAVLYHGTAIQFLESIFQQRLLKGKKHHIHLSTNKETMLRVGMCHGKSQLLTIDADEMHADGLQFFLTGNDVWLTEHVPPKYLQIYTEPET
jgi:putative RNA 2'-phosphotransferase